MRAVELTQNQWTLVDDEDYDFAQGRLWTAHWCPRGNCYYATREENEKSLRLHTEILKRHGLLVEGKSVNHKNWDTLDNQKINLECITQQEQCRYQRKFRTNTSGFIGVNLHNSGRYRAYYRLNGKHKYIGLFGTAEEAARARDIKVAQEYGRFAVLNFP